MPTANEKERVGSTLKIGERASVDTGLIINAAIAARVGKQHDTELRSGHVEAFVLQFERWMSITRVLMSSPSLRARAASGSSMTGDWSVATAPEARRRVAQGTAACRHVQEFNAGAGGRDRLTTKAAVAAPGTKRSEGGSTRFVLDSDYWHPGVTIG